ncbi:MAG: hypothetical protein Kow0069_21730 [Promethearchaeota archaeon]
MAFALLLLSVFAFQAKSASGLKYGNDQIVDQDYNYTVVDDWTRFTGANLRLTPVKIVNAPEKYELSDNFEGYSNQSVPTSNPSGQLQWTVHGNARRCYVLEPNEDDNLKFTWVDEQGSHVLVQSKAEGKKSLVLDNVDEEATEPAPTVQTRASVKFPSASKGTVSFRVLPVLSQSSDVDRESVVFRFKLMYTYKDYSERLLHAKMYLKSGAFYLAVASMDQYLAEANFTTYDFDWVVPQWVNVTLVFDAMESSVALEMETLAFHNTFYLTNEGFMPPTQTSNQLNTTLMNRLEFSLETVNNENQSYVFVDSLQTSLRNPDAGVYANAMISGPWQYENGTETTIYQSIRYMTPAFFKLGEYWEDAPWWFYRVPMVVPTDNATWVREHVRNLWNAQDPIVERGGLQPVGADFRDENSISTRSFNASTIDEFSFKYEAGDGKKEREYDYDQLKPDVIYVSYFEDLLNLGILKEVRIYDGDPESSLARDSYIILSLRAATQAVQDVPGYPLFTLLGSAALVVALGVRRR